VQFAARRVAASCGGASDGVAEGGHTQVGDAVTGGDLVHGVEFPAGGFEGGFQADDLAEPALAASLGDAVLEVVADLQQPGLLCWVGAELRAPDAPLTEHSPAFRQVTARFWCEVASLSA
jgi:hypothetical protein